MVRPDGTIWIGSIHYGLGTELRDNSGIVLRLCQLMDGSRSVERVLAGAAGSCSQGEMEDIREVISFLIESGWVEDAGASRPANLSPAEVTRYGRNTDFFSWIDQSPRGSPLELQATLKGAGVTIIGMGGIGSAVAMSLAAAGVGRIHCVDGDVVELSNLNRQLVYTEHDIGRHKVTSAVASLQSLNSSITVTGDPVMVHDPKEMARQVGNSDVFMVCAENMESMANQVALQLRTPWIIAAYTGPMMAVCTYVPGHTGCYSCLLATEEERMRDAGRADLDRTERIPGFNPVIAPTAQIAGHFAAYEALRLLLGMEVQTAGRMLHRNFLDYDHQYYVDGSARPDCPMCSDRNGALL